MSRVPQNPDVIVIGAGAAGLAAAQALQNAGRTVAVLEAADHIGGRCVTDTRTFGQPFDRGGAWLHSAPINPLARLAEARGATLHKTPWRPVWAQVDDHDLSPSQMTAYAAQQQRIWDRIDAAGERPQDSRILDVIEAGPWATATAHYISHEMGGDADVMSVHDSLNYAEEEGDWLVGGGLGAFVAALHDDVPVQLNCPVQSIDTSGAGVTVQTALGTLRADHVVLTVSTGVLAAESITFHPPLPAAKRDAVAGLPNGLLNKIALDFDPAWAEASEGQTAEYLQGSDAFCSIEFGFYGTAFATGFVGGRCADALEREGRGAATAFCLEALRAIFGSNTPKAIRQTDETAWRANPLTRGAYSYALPHHAPARLDLAQTIAERLFFAGEATMPHSYSTVHGAYLSGQAAAARVLATRT